MEFAREPQPSGLHCKRCVPKPQPCIGFQILYSSSNRPSTNPYRILLNPTVTLLIILTLITLSYPILTLIVIISLILTLNLKLIIAFLISLTAIPGACGETFYYLVSVFNASIHYLLSCAGYVMHKLPKKKRKACNVYKD